MQTVPPVRNISPARPLVTLQSPTTRMAAKRQQPVLSRCHLGTPSFPPICTARRSRADWNNDQDGRWADHQDRLVQTLRKSNGPCAPSGVGWGTCRHPHPGRRVLTAIYYFNVTIITARELKQILFCLLFCWMRKGGSVLSGILPLVQCKSGKGSKQERREDEVQQLTVQN